MFKAIGIAALAACCLCSHAQNLFFTGYFGGNEVPVYGSFLSDTLKNEGTAAAGFYINYQSKDSFGVNRPEKEKLFYSDSMFAVWLHGCAKSGVAEERLLEYSRALAGFYKSNRNFRNYLNIAQPVSFNSLDSGYAKMAGLNAGNASFHNQQCSDYARRAVTALYLLWVYGLDTAACNPVNYRQADIPGKHSVFEINYHGKWAFVDVDPGTPGFMFPDGAGGFYSLQDLMDDSDLIKANWIFKNDDGSEFGEIFADSVRAAAYKLLFTVAPVYLPPLNIQLQQVTAGYSITGEIALPAKSFLVFSYAHNAICFNAAIPQTIQVLDSALRFLDQYDQDNDPTHLDSFNLLVSAYLANELVTPGIVEDVSSRNAVGFYSGKWAPHFEQGTTRPAILSYFIEAGNDTLVIGKDIAGPFVVVGVETDTPIVIGRLLITDTFSVELWGESNSGGPQAIGEDKVNYLTHGFVPPHTKCRIDVAYNQGYIDWWNGYSIDQLGQNDTLVLHRTQNVRTYNSATAISDMKPDRQSIAVRLTQAQFIQLFPACKLLTNINGQQVATNEQLSSGLYFMARGSTVIRVLITE